MGESGIRWELGEMKTICGLPVVEGEFMPLNDVKLVLGVWTSDGCIVTTEEIYTPEDRAWDEFDAALCRRLAGW